MDQRTYDLTSVWIFGTLVAMFYAWVAIKINDNDKDKK